jgi:hypothetical protein
MDAERQYIEDYFLRTLDDLEHKIDSNDYYQILGISALVRRLLVDSFPLVDKVNRYYRLKILYRIAISNTLKFMESMGIPKSGLALLSLQDGLDPDTASPGKTICEVDLEKFLNTTVLVKDGKEYSIRDIVTYEANVDGGVHLGSPKEQAHKEIIDINKSILIGGYSPLLRQLKSIGRVVLKGLKPLREDVQKNAIS